MPAFLNTTKVWFWYELLVLAYIALVGVVSDIHGVLMVIAFYGFTKIPLLIRTSSASEKRLMFVFVAYFLLGIYSYLFVTTAEYAYRYLEKYLVFLWAIPIYAVIRESEHLKRILPVVIPYVAITLGIATTIEIFLLGHYRAQLFTENTMFLAYVSAVLSVWSLIMANRHRQDKVFYFAALFALVACVLTGTRGALLAWFAGVFILMLRKDFLSRHIKQLVISLVMAIVVIISILPQYNARIIKMINTIEDPHAYANSSTGKRFLMWGAAWDMFKDSPVTGVGIGEYHTRLNVMIDNGDYPKYLSKYAHPHNSFMSSLASTGLIGLLVVIAVFYVPFNYFRSQLARTEGDENDYALLGVVFVVMMSLIAMTESIFERQAIAAYYVAMISILYSLIRKATLETAKSS